MEVAGRRFVVDEKLLDLRRWQSAAFKQQDYFVTSRDQVLSTRRSGRCCYSIHHLLRFSRSNAHVVGAV